MEIFFEVEETVERISKASRVPVYVCWNYYLDKGVLGGAVISGYQQGEEAGKNCLEDT